MVVTVNDISFSRVGQFPQRLHLNANTRQPRDVARKIVSRAKHHHRNRLFQESLHLGIFPGFDRRFVQGDLAIVTKKPCSRSLFCLADHRHDAGFDAIGKPGPSLDDRLQIRVGNAARCINCAGFCAALGGYPRFPRRFR